MPTTPTTASIIAGIQCQEAVKLLHGLERSGGAGLRLRGTSHQSYVVAYTRKEDCPSHEPYEPIESLPLSRRRHDAAANFWNACGATWGRQRSSNSTTICCRRCRARACGRDEPVFKSLGKVGEEEGKCPGCGADRVPHTFHTITGDEAVSGSDAGADRRPAVGHSRRPRGNAAAFLRISGDASVVSGDLRL